MRRKMTVVLSGGQDSTTCLFWALNQGADVRAVFVNYGQRHLRERRAAQAMATITRIPFEEIDVSNVLIGTSPLISKHPLEQYDDWHNLPGGLEKTFVPMRNQLFLTLAANRAVAWGCDTLVTGVCQEDFGGYPDCRKTFILAVEAAIRLGTFLEDQPFHIETPLMDLDKATSVRVAMAMPGCYGALGWSHTAYDGAYPPTGKDHATLLRAKGFELAGMPDPLVVRAVWEDVMALPDTPNYRHCMSLISKYKPKTAVELDWATPLDQNPYYIEFIHDRLEMLAKELVR